jgi:hypothetical protein
MPAGHALEVEDLIETDARILDQVRKDLNQEYVRLMSRALQAARRPEPGEGTSKPATPGSSDKSI